MPLRRLDYAEELRAGGVPQLLEGALAALDADGVVCIEGAVEGAVVAAVLEEIGPFVEAIDRDKDAGKVFPTDGATRRAGALAARSPTSHKLITHPGAGLRRPGAVRRLPGVQPGAGRPGAIRTCRVQLGRTALALALRPHMF